MMPPTTHFKGVHRSTSCSFTMRHTLYSDAHICVSHSANVRRHSATEDSRVSRVRTAIILKAVNTLQRQLDMCKSSTTPSIYLF